MADPNQTIIIKKINKGGHAPHGGAWKVAYADFVTAMMAFFLLMWLLTATPVENLQGLADYFTPTLGLQGKMGIGFSGGQAPNTEGVSQGDWASQGLIFGAPPSGPIVKFPESDNKIDVENPEFSPEDMVKENLETNLGETQYMDSVLIEETPEGLRIQIMDDEDRPMFKDGTADLEDHTKYILNRIVKTISHIPNYVSITGHTKADKKKGKEQDYTNWELSADRANSARRFMVSVGMDHMQVAKVVGKADHDLLDLDNPYSPSNSRVSITLLKKSNLSMHKQVAPDDILLGPIDDGLESFVQEKNDKKERRKRDIERIEQKDKMRQMLKREKNQKLKDDGMKQSGQKTPTNELSASSN